MRSRALLLAWFALAAGPAGLGGCTESNDGVNPAFPNGGLLLAASPAPQSAYEALQGFYARPTEAGPFTDRIVAKASPRTLSLFFDRDASYAILRAGCSPYDGRLVLEGYWRRGLRSDRGLLRLFVAPAEYGRALCAGVAPRDALPPGERASLAGAWSAGDAVPHVPVRFAFDGPLLPFRDRFLTVGHRAGCFPQFDCGASGNSLETIRLAQALGSDAIEVDVRVTRDGVPILYHDARFDAYLARGRFCVGAVKDNTFAEVRASCRLAQGELVPTLQEALEVAYVETSLLGLYLDTKTKDAIPAEVELALAYRDRADADGRPFRVVVGITNDEVAEAFAAVAPPGTPCLVEHSLDVARRLGCAIYSPTWTAGPRVAEVEAAQAEGRAVFFWTVNGIEIIDTMLTEARPNGLVTDRPGLVFYRYQTLGIEPRAPLPWPGGLSERAP